MTEAPQPAPETRRFGRCLPCALVLLGSCLLGWLALRAFWRSEIVSVRASLEARQAPLAPVSTRVELLLRAGELLEQLPVGDGVALLQGSSLDLLRAALEDPDSETGAVVYEEMSDGDPAELAEALAALGRASRDVDELVDSLTERDWRELARERFPWPEGSDEAGDGLHLLSVQRRLLTRAACLQLEGDTEGAWRQIERMLALASHCARPTHVAAHRITQGVVGCVQRAVLSQIAESGAPERARLRRVRAALKRLEASASPAEAIRGEALAAYARVRAQPTSATAAALEGNPVRYEGEEQPGLKATLARFLLGDLWTLELLRGMRTIAAESDPCQRESWRRAERVLEQAGPFLRAEAARLPVLLVDAQDQVAALRCVRLALEIAADQPTPELVDPWSGLPLRYAWREDGRVWIWSVGCDGVDDQGQVPRDFYFPEVSLQHWDPHAEGAGEDLVRALPIPANQGREGR